MSSDGIQQANDEQIDDRPVYSFVAGIGADSTPTLEAVKSWPGGGASLPLATYDTLDEATVAERALAAIRKEGGLEAAAEQAERMAVMAGTLDPARPNGQIFPNGPTDPFTTRRDRELVGLDYRYDVTTGPGDTFELQAVKAWEVDGDVGSQAIPLGTYDRPGDARTEADSLRALRAERGLGAEMDAVERIAVENGALPPDRADPRLFREGPPDPFVTERGRELAAADGYTFRAGPALDDDGAAGRAFSLDLVRAERDGADYRFNAVEMIRVLPEDTPYVADASARFNRMLTDVGPAPAAGAASFWARRHGAEPGVAWREVDAESLDRREPPAMVPRPRGPDVSEDAPRRAAPSYDVEV